MQEHPRDDTHYRWPSPSLPPTLTKKPLKRGAAAAKSKVAAAAGKKRPSPTSSEREMIFSTSTTSAGTESTSTAQRREVQVKSAHSTALRSPITFQLPTFSDEECRRRRRSVVRRS